MFGMQIESIEENKDWVKVITTGAIYTIKKSNPAEILCYQRLGKERLVATLMLGISLKGLEVDYQDKESCFLYQPVGSSGVNLRINADSLLSIRTAFATTKATYKGNWAPEYSAVEKGNFMLIDEFGGIAGYLLPSNKEGGYNVQQASMSFEKDGWRISLPLNSRQTFLTSVFPPRAFDWEKSFKERVVHHYASEPTTIPWQPYPRDEEIKEYSQYGSILQLHWWNQGFMTRKGEGVKSKDDTYKRDAWWACFHYVPIDEKELIRVVKTSHKLGMKIVPYKSPIFCLCEVDEFIEEVKVLIEKYDFDGIYFDGVSNDIWRAYKIMKGTRKVLKDKILYAHVPSPIIGEYYDYQNARYVYCPFIDTYADYTLRAEHVFKFDWKYLRYTISGYNISNSIGYVCNYDFEPEFTRKLIKPVLKANARLAHWGGEEAFVKEKLESAGRKFYPGKETLKILKEKYFPALDQLQKKILE